jgi:hypothetical protein
MFFRKQLEQLVKTTSYFSPRNRAAILKSGADLSAKALAKVDAPGWQELFLSVVMVVSFSTKLILIYIPCATPTTHPPPTNRPLINQPPKTFQLKILSDSPCTMRRVVVNFFLTKTAMSESPGCGGCPSPMAGRNPCH